jgi:hypothetical protein
MLRSPITPSSTSANLGKRGLATTKKRRCENTSMAAAFYSATISGARKNGENVQAQMRDVSPDIEPVELPLMHPLFHCVFELSEKPQVSSIHSFIRGKTTERDDAAEAHYWAYFDKEKRMVALFCQNTDLGDGWERVGVDPDYTREMSVARAFPMGINIVFFALSQNTAKK